MLFFRIAAQLAFCGACLLCGVVALGADYALVVSKATRSDSEWSRVVEELVAKHQAEVIVYDKDVSESLPALCKSLPRCACFVATNAEATIQMVADVHRLPSRHRGTAIARCGSLRHGRRDKEHFAIRNDGDPPCPRSRRLPRLSRGRKIAVRRS